MATRAGVCAQEQVQATWLRQWLSPFEESDDGGARPSGQSPQSIMPLVVV
jgi:hypothetical protein